MSADYKIHLFGASGSGTSTLGAALAQRLSLPHLDVDDFYWRPTNPPFVEKQQPAQRLLDLNEAMMESQGWILSGSLCGWGDELIPRFSHAVFLFLQPHLRQQRLRLRERQRHGDRILPGHDCTKFIPSLWPGPRVTTAPDWNNAVGAYTNNGRRSCLARCCSLIAISR